jgi:hypothetical protein
MPRGRLRQAATNAEQRPLRFEEWLVLNQWLLGLFGVSKFEHLAAKLKAPELEGFDENNVTRFYHALCLYIRSDWRPALPDNQLLAHDENIVRHWKQITERRNPRRTVSLSEVLSVPRIALHGDLPRPVLPRPGQAARACSTSTWKPLTPPHPRRSRIEPYTRQDLNKVAFWMATGSGKTLLMHINILQYQHYLNLYGGRQVNRVILLTPNEGTLAPASGGIPALGYRGRTLLEGGAGPLHGPRRRDPRHPQAAGGDGREDRGRGRLRGEQSGPRGRRPSRHQRCGNWHLDAETEPTLRERLFV